MDVNSSPHLHPPAAKWGAPNAPIIALTPPEQPLDAAAEMKYGRTDDILDQDADAKERQNLPTIVDGAPPLPVNTKVLVAQRSKTSTPRSLQTITAVTPPLR